MSETGAIKFRYEHLTMDLAQFAGFAELNLCRRRLLELGLIGTDANGIGFGNLSIRIGENSRSFYITGSGTGKFSDLTTSHYARVAAYDFDNNWLRCEGAVVASSESLTHAAVYDSSPSAMAVIHVHDMKLWSRLQDKVPTTPGNVPYGTPEMAAAVRQLFEITDLETTRAFVMTAHQSGLVTFGASLDEAFDVLIALRTQ